MKNLLGDLLQVSLLDSEGIDHWLWKCLAFSPKATERLFTEQFWFCHHALPLASHSDGTLLLRAFQRHLWA